MSRPLIALSLSVSLLSFGAVARAEGAAFDPEACVAGVRVAVGPPTIDPATARQILEQITSELGPQRASRCEDAATRVDVDLADPDRARVVVEAQEGEARRRIERTIDLAPIAEDGRALAIAIAVDEVAREVREQLAIRPRIPAPRPPRSPPRSEPELATPRLRRPSYGLGSALALDAFTTGQVLVGPDARAVALLGDHVGVVAHGGVRGALAWSGAHREAWAFGASLEVAKDTRAPSGVSGTIGVDGWLVRARPDVVATIAPSLGGAAWIRLAPSLRLTLDGRAALPVVPLRAAPHAASGVAVSWSLGVLATF